MMYFAYGSNMSSKELRGWCPSAKGLGPAKLPGYRLEFTRYSDKWGGGVADIVPDEGSEVWGVMYEIDAEELPTLDEKEGVPRGAYRRQQVTAETPAGSLAGALTYVVVDKRPCPPAPLYLETLVLGATEFDLPDTYVDSLRKIPTAQ